MKFSNLIITVITVNRKKANINEKQLSAFVFKNLLCEEY